MLNSKDFLKKYNDMNDLLIGFAMRLTKNRTEAEDLIQDTVCKAYKNKDRFQVGTNFKAWMTTIMRNSYINGYRKKKTRNTVSAPVEDFTYSLESSSRSQADSTVLLNDLTAIIDSLSDTYRVPFLLSYRGFQYNEIAERLDIPMGTVKSRINYARKQLKEKIELNYSYGISLAA
jgi:RNA polymerase sigma-70 factor (ECF subfamily)